MPIRVNCPSCGRSGRLPDHAVGRNIRCPACQHSYRLTADMALPEGLELIEDDEPSTPTPPPRLSGPKPKTLTAGPVSEPEADPYDDPYGDDEAWPASPKAPAAAPRAAGKPATGLKPGPKPDRRGSSAVLNTGLPVQIAGVILFIAAFTFTSIKSFEFFRGTGQPPAPVKAPSPLARLKSPSQPGSTPANPTPLPRVASARPAVPIASPPAVASTRSPVPTPAPTPAVAAGDPEPAGESDVARKARASAGLTRDDGAGKALSTSEIVAESEPSVALVKGAMSSGTGFLVAPGLLATNSHVVDDEFIPDLQVHFVSADNARKGPVRAELLYEDPERDIALLAVKTDLPPLRVAKAYSFRKGEDITVIGNPGDGDGSVLENAISRGVMSTKTQVEGQNFYQLGIAINPGNSGGPVFDSSGRVVGVATLKSIKQEATGFAIPVEDLQTAIAKLAEQTTADAERYRSRHRLITAVKGLGSGGAILCLGIDLRRAARVSSEADLKAMLERFEKVVSILEKDAFPSFGKQVPRVTKDPLVPQATRAKIAQFLDNFGQIRSAYPNGANVGDDKLRPWKQTHRRLFTELSGDLKLEVPQGIMVAFDDHAPNQGSVVVFGSPALGSARSRLLERHGIGPRGMPGAPGLSRSPGINRPPSLRDRFGRGRR